MIGALYNGVFHVIGRFLTGSRGICHTAILGID